jgi:hypothetical protein
MILPGIAVKGPSDLFLLSSRELEDLGHFRKLPEIARPLPCQGRGRGFEPLRPLQVFYEIGDFLEQGFAAYRLDGAAWLTKSENPSDLG